jgi:hypothetical protein
MHETQKRASPPFKRWHFVVLSWAWPGAGRDASWANAVGFCKLAVTDEDKAREQYLRDQGFWRVG